MAFNIDWLRTRYPEGPNGKRPYEYYVDIVTKRYFHGVDNKRLDLILDCFHEDSFLLEVVSDTRHEGRDVGIRHMFENLINGNERIWHGNFVHTVDVERECIGSQFSVEVRPNGEDERRHENCNRFHLRDGRFERVYIYRSAIYVGGEDLLD